MQYRGNAYGRAVALNIAMLANKKASPECPAAGGPSPTPRRSSAKTKVTEGLGIAMQIGEAGGFYHWYPLFTADAPYAFARNAEAPTTPTTWVSGSRWHRRPSGLQRLTKEGIFEAGIYDIARETFADGVAVPIAGPWRVPDRPQRWVTT